MSVPDHAGAHYFHKCSHRDLLGNQAFLALDPATAGIYFRLRLLAGQTWNNGSLAMGATRRMTLEDVIEYMVGSCHVPNRRKAREIAGRLVSGAGLLKVSKAGVVTIARWADEQAVAAPVALRQRMHRVREALREYMIAHGVESYTASREAWRLASDRSVIDMVSAGAARSRVLALADPVIAAANASRPAVATEGQGKAPSVPSPGPAQAHGSGAGSGCDMSHIGCVTCHTDTRVIPESRPEKGDSVSLNPEPDSVAPPAASGSGHSVQGAGPGEGTEGASTPAVLRDPDAMRRMKPVDAACALTREFGELARNTYAKRMRELSEAYGQAVGPEVFYDCLAELRIEILEGRAKVASSLLNRIFRRRIDGAAGGAA